MLLFISKLFFKEGIINKLIEMNSFIKICPSCKKHIKYTLDKQFIKMKCECGFSSSMKINTIPIGDNNNHIFKEIKIDLEKGKKFLNSDFNAYKDELINEYLKQINELKSANEESYKRNMNMYHTYRYLLIIMMNQLKLEIVFLIIV